MIANSPPSMRRGTGLITAPTVQPGVGAKLAGAIRTVNAAWHRLPAERRPPIRRITTRSDAEVDATFAAGDRAYARAAIEARARWLA
jgi:hypothetical protein